MAEPQLSVRSARAREMAHRLARRERRTVAEIVLRALEAYDIAQTGREPAKEFFVRVSRDFGADVDLEKVIRENRLPNSGIDLWSSLIQTTFQKPFARNPSRGYSSG